MFLQWFLFSLVAVGGIDGLSTLPPSSLSAVRQQLQRRQQSSLAAVFSTTDESTSLSNDESNNKAKKKSVWFPTRIQETLDYSSVAQRLYVRHIVTETEAMAEWVVQQYTQQQTSSSTTTTTTTKAPDDDPFASLARQISACPTTRAEGGRIGWIERTTSFFESTLPSFVVSQLFAQQPKAGDVLILTSSSSSSPNSPQRWHVIQVMELWAALPPLQQDEDDDDDDENGESSTRIVGSHMGINRAIPRKKLKGHGVLPAIRLNRLKSYHIQTAGCQMNVADSERLEGILQHQLNLKVAENPKDADLILFNTCSIRDHAEQKLYDAIGPYAAQKRKGKSNLALVVTGCVAQQEGQALLRRIPEIDIVLGPQYVPHLAAMLQRVEHEASQIVVTRPMFASSFSETISDDFHSPPVRGHTVRAWVNVIFGCNEHCTYCVVPATRGMEQSRTMESILQECLTLASAGYKEVTLLGQNIDAYGRDMVPKRTFADLLQYLNANIPTKLRIRYVTSHPRYFSDRVIDAVANLDKLCECFHVPFQAGDDAVLRAMRRGYTYDSYMRIIHKIRKQAPDSAICGDVIVGFPGETEEAFQKTLRLMEEVKFDNLNTFAYSPRPNTEAASRDHHSQHVPEDVKADRLQRVQKLAAQHGLERSQRYLGRTVEVLVEDANPRDPQHQVMGRTRQGRQVYFDGNLEELRGEFVQVRITEARTWSLAGEVAGND